MQQVFRGMASVLFSCSFIVFQPGASASAAIFLITSSPPDLSSPLWFSRSASASYRCVRRQVSDSCARCDGAGVGRRVSERGTVVKNSLGCFSHDDCLGVVDCSASTETVEVLSRVVDHGSGHISLQVHVGWTSYYSFP
ncbi:hypothetical protein MLD38_008182 [Melastoma candidum]|uniref:Uncharacterized protein n=1 Tax=Melastoma candidum TaxID=119954 RepID=A0ACB9RSL8_9MYRT|nr:hypothetical protein MLD38_008182 [Melastoma candidum]